MDNSGESLMVIVTPSPLEDFRIGEKAQRLSDEKVAMWEKSWGARVGRLEMENGEGRPWTKSEKEAGADGTRSLNEEEPAPQTLYYRPAAKSTDPVLVNVQLQYGRQSAKVTRRR